MSNEMTAWGMTDKELDERIDTLLALVAFIEAELDDRDPQLVQSEMRALLMALSDLYEEKSKRSKT